MELTWNRFIKTVKKNFSRSSGDALKPVPCSSASATTGTTTAPISTATVAKTSTVSSTSVNKRPTVSLSTDTPSPTVKFQTKHSELDCTIVKTETHVECTVSTATTTMSPGKYKKYLGGDESPDYLQDFSVPYEHKHLYERNFPYRLKPEYRNPSRPPFRHPNNRGKFPTSRFPVDKRNHPRQRYFAPDKYDYELELHNEPDDCDDYENEQPRSSSWKKYPSNSERELRHEEDYYEDLETDHPHSSRKKFPSNSNESESASSADSRHKLDDFDWKRSSNTVNKPSDPRLRGEDYDRRRASTSSETRTSDPSRLWEEDFDERRRSVSTEARYPESSRMREEDFEIRRPSSPSEFAPRSRLQEEDFDVRRPSTPSDSRYKSPDSRYSGDDYDQRFRGTSSTSTETRMSHSAYKASREDEDRWQDEPDLRQFIRKKHEDRLMSSESQHAEDARDLYLKKRQTKPTENRVAFSDYRLYEKSLQKSRKPPDRVNTSDETRTATNNQRHFNDDKLFTRKTDSSKENKVDLPIYRSLVSESYKALNISQTSTISTDPFSESIGDPHSSTLEDYDSQNESRLVIDDSYPDEADQNTDEQSKVSSESKDSTIMGVWEESQFVEPPTKSVQDKLPIVGTPENDSLLFEKQNHLAEVYKKRIELQVRNLQAQCLAYEQSASSGRNFKSEESSGEQSAGSGRKVGSEEAIVTNRRSFEAELEKASLATNTRNKKETPKSVKSKSMMNVGNSESETKEVNVLKPKTRVARSLDRSENKIRHSTPKKEQETCVQREEIASAEVKKKPVDSNTSSLGNVPVTERNAKKINPHKLVKSIEVPVKEVKPRTTPSDKDNISDDIQAIMAPIVQRNKSRSKTPVESVQRDPRRRERKDSNSVCTSDRVKEVPLKMDNDMIDPIMAKVESSYNRQLKLTKSVGSDPGDDSRPPEGTEETGYNAENPTKPPVTESLTTERSKVSSDDKYSSQSVKTVKNSAATNKEKVASRDSSSDVKPNTENHFISKPISVRGMTEEDIIRRPFMYKIHPPYLNSSDPEENGEDFNETNKKDSCPVPSGSTTKSVKSRLSEEVGTFHKVGSPYGGALRGLKNDNLEARRMASLKTGAIIDLQKEVKKPQRPLAKNKPSPSSIIGNISQEELQRIVEKNLSNLPNPLDIFNHPKETPNQSVQPSQANFWNNSAPAGRYPTFLQGTERVQHSSSTSVNIINITHTEVNRVNQIQHQNMNRGGWPVNETNCLPPNNYPFTTSMTLDNNLGPNEAKSVYNPPALQSDPFRSPCYDGSSTPDPYRADPYTLNLHQNSVPGCRSATPLFDMPKTPLLETPPSPYVQYDSYPSNYNHSAERDVQRHPVYNPMLVPENNTGRRSLLGPHPLSAYNQQMMRPQYNVQNNMYTGSTPSTYAAWKAEKYGLRPKTPQQVNPVNPYQWRAPINATTEAGRSLAQVEDTARKENDVKKISARDPRRQSIEEHQKAVETINERDPRRRKRSPGVEPRTIDHVIERTSSRDRSLVKEQSKSPPRRYKDRSRSRGRVSLRGRSSSRESSSSGSRDRSRSRGRRRHRSRSRSRSRVNRSQRKNSRSHSRDRSRGRNRSPEKYRSKEKDRYSRSSDRRRRCDYSSDRERRRSPSRDSCRRDRSTSWKSERQSSFEHSNSSNPDTKYIIPKKTDDDVRKETNESESIDTPTLETHLIEPKESSFETENDSNEVSEKNIVVSKQMDKTHDLESEITAGEEISVKSQESDTIKPQLDSELDKNASVSSSITPKVESNEQHSDETNPVSKRDDSTVTHTFGEVVEPAEEAKRTGNPDDSTFCQTKEENETKSKEQENTENTSETVCGSADATAESAADAKKIKDEEINDNDQPEEKQKPESNICGDKKPTDKLDERIRDLFKTISSEAITDEKIASFKSLVLIVESCDKMSNKASKGAVASTSDNSTSKCSETNSKEENETAEDSVPSENEQVQTLVAAENVTDSETPIEEGKARPKSKLKKKQKKKTYVPKKSAQQQPTIKKRRNKNELDKLQDDISGYHDSDAIAAASGPRKCRLLKEKPVDTDNLVEATQSKNSTKKEVAKKSTDTDKSKRSPSPTFDYDSSDSDAPIASMTVRLGAKYGQYCKSEELSKLEEIKAKLLQKTKLSKSTSNNLMVSETKKDKSNSSSTLNHIVDTPKDITNKKKRPSLPKGNSRSESVDDEESNKEVFTNEISEVNYSDSTRPQESESDSDRMSSHSSNSGKKKRKKKSWSVGIIKKKTNTKKPKCSNKEVLNTDENVSDEVSEEEEEKEPVNDNISDIDYYQDGDFDAIKCMLCSFKGKSIVSHYTITHPKDEVSISRMSPQAAKLAIKESKLFFKTGLVKDSKYTCRFCSHEFPKQLVFFEHLALHSGEYRHECCKCGYRTSTRSGIVKHFHTVHINSTQQIPGKQPKVNCRVLYKPPSDISHIEGFLCNQCNFFQQEEKNIRRHLIITHDLLNASEFTKINCSLLHYDEKDYSTSGNDEEEKEETNTSNETEACEDTQRVDKEAKHGTNTISVEKSQSEVLNKETSSTEDMSEKETLEMADKGGGKSCKIPEENVPKEPSKTSQTQTQKNKSKQIPQEEEITEDNVQDDEMSDDREEASSDQDESVNENDNIEPESGIDCEEREISKSPGSIKGCFEPSEDHIELNTLEEESKNRYKMKSDEILASIPVRKNGKHKSDVIQAIDSKFGYENEDSPTLMLKDLIKEKTVVSEVSSQETMTPESAKLDDNPVRRPQLERTCKSQKTNYDNSLEADITETDVVDWFRDIGDSLDEVLTVDVIHQENILSQISNSSMSLPLYENQIQRCKEFLDQPFEMEPQIRVYQPIVPDNVNTSEFTFVMQKIARLTVKPSESHAEIIVGGFRAIRTDEEMTYTCNLKIFNKACDFKTAALNDFGKHVNLSHQNCHWDGTCITCFTVFVDDPVKHVKTSVHTQNAAFCHLVTEHLTFDSADGTFASAVRDEPVSPEETPRIRVRRLSGDKLSTPRPSLDNSLVSTGDLSFLIISPVRESFTPGIPASPGIPALADVTLKLKLQEFYQIDFDSESMSTRKQLVEVCKTRVALTNMLQRAKLRQFYKCMGFNCSYTAVHFNEFAKHLHQHRDLHKSNPRADPHKGYWRRCAYCSNEYSTFDELGVHLRRSHASCLCQCGLCFYRARSIVNVAHHHNQEHGENETLIVLQCEDPEKISCDPPEERNFRYFAPPLECNKGDCRLFTYMISRYLGHLLDSHIREVFFGCFKCKFSCSNLILLLKHLKVHHFIGMFQCQYCQYGCFAESEVKTHLCYKHPEQLPVSIARTQCSPSETTKYAQQEVMKRIVYYNKNLDKLNEYLIPLPGSSSTLPVKAATQGDTSSRAPQTTTKRTPTGLQRAQSPSTPVTIAVSKLQPRSLEFTTPLSALALVVAGSSRQEPVAITEPSRQEPLAIAGPSRQDYLAIPGPSTRDPMAIPGPSTRDPMAIPGPSTSDPMAIPGPSTRDDLAIPGPSRRDDLAIPGPSHAPGLLINEVPDTPSSPDVADTSTTETSSSVPEESSTENSQQEESNSPHKEVNYFKCGNKNCDFDTSCSTVLKEHLIMCDFARQSQRLTCVFCKRGFKLPDSLISHLRIHGPARFACALCEFKDPIKDKVVSHLKSAHQAADTLLIPVDNNFTDTDQAYFIIRPREKSQVKAKPWKRPVSLNRRRFSPEDEDSIPAPPIFQQLLGCTLCPYATKVRLNLVQHLNKHKTGETVIQKKDVVNPKPPEEGKKSMFNQMMNLAASSNAKEEEEEEHEDEDCPYKYMPDNERFQCNVENCNYRSLEPSGLRDHISIIHKEETHYTCPHCEDKPHIPVDQLLLHLKLHDAPLYRCSECIFYSHMKNSIGRHLKLDHSNDPEVSEWLVRRAKVKLAVAPVAEPSPPPPPPQEEEMCACNLCNFQSKTVKQMTAHLVSKHKPDKPFSCPLCSYRCSSGKVFRTHHGNAHKEEPRLQPTPNYSMVKVTKEPVVSNNPVWNRNPRRAKHIRGIMLDERGDAPPPVLTCSSQDDIQLMDVLELKFGKYGKPDEQGNLMCPRCPQYLTKSKQEMKEHLYKDMKYKPHSCTICKVEFTWKKKVEKHVQRNHGIDPAEVSIHIESNEDRELQEWVQNVITRQQSEIRSSVPDEAEPSTSSGTGTGRKRRRSSLEDGVPAKLKKPSPSGTPVKANTSTSESPAKASVSALPARPNASVLPVGPDFPPVPPAIPIASLFREMVPWDDIDMEFEEDPNNLAENASEDETWAPRVGAVMNVDLNRRISLRNSFRHQCDHCSANTKFRTSLALHQSISHPELATKFVEDHEELKTDGFSCIYCNCFALYMHDLKAHWSTMHKRDNLNFNIKRKSVRCEFEYQCYICKKSGNVFTLEEHYISNHPGKNLLLMPVAVPKYKCSECKLVFNSIDILNRHFGIDHPEKDFCFLVVSSQKPFPTPSPEATCVSRAASYKCFTCHFTCVEYRAMVRHVRRHYTTYQCQLCNTLFPTVFSIRGHMNTKHPGDDTKPLVLDGSERDLEKAKRSIVVICENGKKRKITEGEIDAGESEDDSQDSLSPEKASTRSPMTSPSKETARKSTGSPTKHYPSPEKKTSPRKLRVGLKKKSPKRKKLTLANLKVEVHSRGKRVKFPACILERFLDFNSEVFLKGVESAEERT